MAYIDQKIKEEILKEVKKVLPDNWKVSARIKDACKIILTVKMSRAEKAEYEQYLEKLAEAKTLQAKQKLREDTKIVSTLGQIRAALNSKNYDNSEAQRDYFQVGYYSEVIVG